MRIFLIVAIILLSIFSIEAVDKQEKGTVMIDENQPTPDSALDLADEIFQKRNYEEALTKYTELVEQAKTEFN